MLKIVVVDYGMGNLKSVTNAINYLGYNVFVSNKASEIEKANALVLPGVGSFCQAIENLKKLELDIIIKSLCNDKKIPLLGICLGMQILGNDSNEGGFNKGLSLIPGHVRKIPSKDSFRLPHIGWNNITIKNKNPIFKNINTDSSFYFVHSYRFECDQSFISSSTEYSSTIVSSIQKENIFGVQFHPEKSHKNGLLLLKNFINHVSLGMDY